LDIIVIHLKILIHDGLIPLDIVLKGILPYSLLLLKIFVVVSNIYLSSFSFKWRPSHFCVVPTCYVGNWKQKHK